MKEQMLLNDEDYKEQVGYIPCPEHDLRKVAKAQLAKVINVCPECEYKGICDGDIQKEDYCPKNTIKKPLYPPPRFDAVYEQGLANMNAGGQLLDICPECLGEGYLGEGVVVACPTCKSTGKLNRPEADAL